MKNNKKSNWAMWIIGGVSIIFMVVTLWFNYNHATGLGEEGQGTFGDMFGASNALFTGLSFTGVIIAILLQRQELKLQREELELTRGEMADTRKEFVTQNENLRIQRFENTFFEMISLFNTIVNNTSIQIDNDTYHGRKAFNKISEVIALDAQNNAVSKEGLRKNYKKIMEDYTVDEVLSFYISSYKLYKEFLAHYFRTFYHIIKLIHNTNGIEKRTYIAYARAQLSSHDMILFLYNGLHENGKEKFKPLIETYTLFDNLDDELLINIEAKNAYAETAFIHPKEN
ncbi:Putative phage abortive infection protein [Chryseobacterium taichungense]|uniref:Putative phage abortive infection protein n=1 Tax=Chryseobacterium taichungense TaxID=295069 RepID=A0A1H8A2Y8_9FLAO|nr:putative phage abortive infection protein [Chryseobacterium taichungense]SEM64208.1 Putative phage abortive infection protein [Chryseobacterium taichungense]